jgi:hypothetical protein
MFWGDGHSGASAIAIVLMGRKKYGGRKKNGWRQMAKEGIDGKGSVG